MKTKEMKQTKQWMTNRDQIKTPKRFSVDMMRMKDGSFQIINGSARAFLKRNQYRTDEIHVDTRDFVNELKSFGIQ